MNNEGKESCPKCKRIAFLTKDHIVPQQMCELLDYLKIPFECNSPENIEFICAACNVEKSNILDRENPIVNWAIKQVHKKNEEGVYIPAKYYPMFKRTLTLSALRKNKPVTKLKITSYYILIPIPKFVRKFFNFN